MKIENWLKKVNTHKCFYIIEQAIDGKYISADLVGKLNGEPVWEVIYECVNDLYETKQEVYYFNAFGEVVMAKDESLIQLPFNSCSYFIKPLIKYISEETQGMTIDGKSYLEELAEVHEKARTEKLDREIDQLELKRARAINKRIRVKSQIKDYISSIIDLEIEQ